MIISEQERSRIKSLYGLLAESVSPDESVFIANENPFKEDTQYSRCRRHYDGYLKDGDCYTIYKPNKDELLNKTKSKFENKKIRLSNHDTIVTTYSVNHINVIDFGTYNPKEDCTVKEIFFKLPSDKSNFVSSISNRISSDFSIVVSVGATSSSGNWISGRVDSLSPLFDEFKFKNLPDEYFEIRRIVRQKTDF
jgi:hypothetical protein